MKKAICFSDVAINSPLIRWAHPLFPSVKESSVACWYFFSFYLFSPCSSLFFPQALCSSFCPYFFFKGHSTIFICLKIWQTDSSRGDGGDYVCGVIRRQFVKPTLLGMGLLRQTIRTVFFQLCCSLENDPFEFHLWLLKDNKINVIEVFPVPKHLASK